MPHSLLRGLSCGALLATLLAVSAPAAAQWVWKDEAGRTIASDQPPPLNTPPSRIVRSPRSRTTTPPPTDDSAAGPAHPDAPKSLADRELDSRQRAKEAADADKKAADDAARAQAMQENCRQVRSNVASLQTGGRAARYDEKGEKVYIDDSQRQAEINRQQAQVAQYCNK